MSAYRFCRTKDDISGLTVATDERIEVIDDDEARPKGLLARLPTPGDQGAPVPEGSPSGDLERAGRSPSG
jgi:hypothetical protein